MKKLPYFELIVIALALSFGNVNAIAEIGFLKSNMNHYVIYSNPLNLDEHFDNKKDTTEVIYYASEQIQEKQKFINNLIKNVLTLNFTDKKPILNEQIIWKHKLIKAGFNNAVNNQKERINSLNSIDNLIKNTYSFKAILDSQGSFKEINQAVALGHTEPKALMELREINNTQHGKLSLLPHLMTNTVLMISQRPMCHCCSRLLLNFLDSTGNQYPNFLVISQDRFLTYLRDTLLPEIKTKVTKSYNKFIEKNKHKKDHEDFEKNKKSFQNFFIRVESVINELSKDKTKETIKSIIDQLEKIAKQLKESSKNHNRIIINIITLMERLKGDDRSGNNLVLLTKHFTN